MAVSMGIAVTSLELITHASRGRIGSFREPRRSSKARMTRSKFRNASERVNVARQGQWDSNWKSNSNDAPEIQPSCNKLG